MEGPTIIIVIITCISESMSAIHNSEEIIKLYIYIDPDYLIIITVMLVSVHNV